MLEKLTNRLMYVFGYLTVLPTVGIIIWTLFFGYYYVFNKTEYDMGEYTSNHVAAAWVTVSLTFGILWAAAFGLHELAEKRQKRLNRRNR